MSENTAGSFAINVGDAHIQRAEEIRQPAPMALLCDDSAFVQKHTQQLPDTFLDRANNTFPLVFQTWVMQVEGLTVVVDPCNGNGRNRLFPFFNQLDTPFLQRFEATGVRPEAVDIVFCTHLHCDHCGWNTRLRDGRWTPTFPNARYLFVRREAERWNPQRPDYGSVDYNAGVFEDSVQPIIAAGLADLVDDRHQVSPALTIEPAYGHTLGHSILRVQSHGEEAFFTGDVFHHPLQLVRPELHMGGCDDLPAAIATRYRLRDQLAERSALMLPAHFPEPHCGRVVKEEDNYRFVPATAA